MESGRRTFIGTALTMVAAAAASKAQLPDASQQPIPQQQEPPSARTALSDAENKFPGEPPVRLDPAAIMRANQDKVKKDVGKMADLIQELQKELNENDSKDILSIDVLKKSEEIEKLAKQVRDMVHG